MRAIRTSVLFLLAGVLPALLAVIPAGCEPRREETGGMLGQEPPGMVVAVSIDASGSFATRTGDAYAFFTAASGEYFQGSVGEHNELVISQISGSGRALLWEGHPGDLRKRFASASDFRSFVASRSDPNASRVHDSVADTVEEVLDRTAGSGGKSRSAVLILSDMVDNASGPDSVRRVTDALRRYREAGGAVGIYWCDQSLVRVWRGHLRAAGFDATNSVVVSEIRDRPPLPRLGD